MCCKVVCSHQQQQQHQHCRTEYMDRALKCRSGILVNRVVLLTLHAFFSLQCVSGDTGCLWPSLKLHRWHFRLTYSSSDLRFRYSTSKLWKLFSERFSDRLAALLFNYNFNYAWRKCWIVTACRQLQSQSQSGVVLFHAMYRDYRTVSLTSSLLIVIISLSQLLDSRRLRLNLSHFSYVSSSAAVHRRAWRRRMNDARRWPSGAPPTRPFHPAHCHCPPCVKILVPSQSLSFANYRRNKELCV